MASIILRFRSKDGMFRINTSSDSDFVSVIEQLLTKLSSAVNSQSLLLSNSPSQKGEPAKDYCGKTVHELGLKNGDMLFVSYETAIDPNAVPTSTPTVPITTTNLGPTKVQELLIDIALDKQEGLIVRALSSMCRHGARGMCEYCAPLPPWNENYRSEHAIKHISFHAYLKQQAEKHKNNGGSYIAPLEEPDYKIDLHCQQGHQPYPKGICSKCQPSPITLQQQKFRMVDHVEFADSSILNEFLNGWRSTGVQRFGYLYGRYEEFDKVPLGIKAVVESIYEPPQVGEFDGVTLLNWDDEQQIDAIASKLGLTKVGIAYTDLTDAGRKDGTVLCKRHKDSYFLTNLECIMAARFQHKYPNVTKYTSSGKFSSKFVTCVVSGGLLGEIEPRSYQVSTGAEALVEADIITGCTQPSMVYVNENSSTRYVPDIQYSKINEYGLEVKSNAKPTFPVDFLLVSLTDSFPVDPTPMFTNEYHYTIENREFMGDVQDLSTVYKYLNGGDYEVRKAKLCNFHFLCHLARLNILGPQEMESIFKFIVDKNEDDYIRLVESPGWMSLITILEENK